MEDSHGDHAEMYALRGLDVSSRAVRVVGSTVAMPQMLPVFEESTMEEVATGSPTEGEMRVLRWEGLNSVAALVNAPPIRLAELLGSPERAAEVIGWCIEHLNGPPETSDDARLERWHGQRRSSAQAAFPDGPRNFAMQHRYGLV